MFLKNCFVAIILLFMGAQSSARSIAPNFVVKSILTDYNIAENIGADHVTGAYVVINKHQGTIKLTVTKKLYCPPGLNCIAQFIHSFSVELPFSKLPKLGNCGQYTYKAKEDERPVDGSLKEITVVDYSNGWHGRPSY